MRRWSAFCSAANLLRLWFYNGFIPYQEFFFFFCKSMKLHSAGLDYTTMNVGSNWRHRGGAPWGWLDIRWGLLELLLEAIKETRHFRPQGARKTAEKMTRNGEKLRRFRAELLGAWLCNGNSVCLCVCETSLSRSRAKLLLGMIPALKYTHADTLTSRC